MTEFVCSKIFLHERNMDYESHKKNFPWIKKIRRKFLKSFPEITEETLSLLKENIHGEFEKLDWNDKLRMEAFYSTLNYFYLHLFMKTHLKEEPVLKFVCVQLLYYLSYTGLILSDGDSESEWLSRILSALKSYTGSYYEVFDVLLLVRNVSKKYLSAYKEILRYILLDPSMKYPSDAENFLKIMLLFRRLKSLLKIDQEEIDDSCLTSEVECPLNLKTFISTLHINGLGQISKKNFIQKFLKKKLSPDILENLFLALFKDKYDDRIICCNFKNNKSKSSTTLSKKKVHSEETFINSDPSSERKSKSKKKHLQNSDSMIKANSSSISQNILELSHLEESSLQVLQNKRKKKKLQSQLEANVSEEHHVPAFNNSECNQSVSDTLEKSYINSEIHSIETFKNSDLLSEMKSRSKAKNSSKSSDSLINSNVPSISENIFDKSHVDESSVQILRLKKKKKKLKSRLKENATVSKHHPVDSFNKSEFKQSFSETFKQSCINTKIQQEDNFIYLSSERKSPSKTKISPEIDSTDVLSVSEDVLNKASIEESSFQILQSKKKKRKKSLLKEDTTVSENVSKHHLVDVFNQSDSNQEVNETFEQSCVNSEICLEDLIISSGLSSERESKCKTKYQESSDLIKADASSISVNILEPSHLEESSSQVLQHKKKYQSQLKENVSKEHPVHSSNKSECNQSANETLEKSYMNSEIHSEENFNNSAHSSERKSKSKTKYLEKSDLIKADAPSISQNIMEPPHLEESSSQVLQHKKNYQSQLKENVSKEHPVHSSNKSESNQSANALENSSMNSEIHSEENFNNSDHSSERKSKSKTKYLEKSDSIKADVPSISQYTLGSSHLEESSSQVQQHKKKKNKYKSQLIENVSDEHPVCVQASSKSESNQSSHDTYEQSCINSDIYSGGTFKNSYLSSEKKSKTNSSDFLIKADVLSISGNIFDKSHLNESSLQILQSKKKLKFHLNENVTVSKQHPVDVFNIPECNQSSSKIYKQSCMNTEIQPEDSFISSDLTSETKIYLERSDSLIQTDIPSVSENNFETGSLEKSSFQILPSKKKKKKKSQVNNKNAPVSENVSEQHPVDDVYKSECEQSVNETLEQSCIDSDIHSEDFFINCDIPFKRESRSKTKYSPKSSDSFLKADVLPNSENILDESCTEELNFHILQYGKEKKQVKSQLKETTMINDNVLDHCPVSNSDKSQFNESISVTNEQLCISSEIHSLKDSALCSNRKYLSETENYNLLIKSNVLSIPQIIVGKSHPEETSFQEFSQVLPDSETTLCDRKNELAERSAIDPCQANNSVSSGSCFNSPVKIINSPSVKHSLLPIAENINSSNKCRFESQVLGEDNASILLERSNSDKSSCSADKSMNTFNFEFCKKLKNSLVISLNKVQSSDDISEAFIYENSISSPESLELCSPPPLLTSLEKNEIKKCDSVYTSDSLTTLSADSLDMASPVKYPVVTQKLSKDKNLADHFERITHSKIIASPDSPSKTQSVAKFPTKGENSTSLVSLVSSDTSNITELNKLLNRKLTFSEHKSIAVPIKSSYSASGDITEAGVDSSSSVDALLNSELTNSRTRIQRYNFRSRRKSKKFVPVNDSSSDSSQNVSSNKLNKKESSSLQAKKFKSRNDSFSEPTNTKTKIRRNVYKKRISKKFVSTSSSDSDIALSKLKDIKSKKSVNSFNSNLSTFDSFDHSVDTDKLNKKESSSLKAKQCESSCDSSSDDIVLSELKTVKSEVSVNSFNPNVSTSDNLNQNAKSNKNEKKCITESYEESFIESQLSDKETAPLIGGNTNLSNKSSDKTIALDSEDLFSNSNCFALQNVSNNEVEGIISDTSNLADKEICENSSASSTFHSLFSESSQMASVIADKNSNGEVCFDMSSLLGNQNSNDKFQTESTTLPNNMKELRIVLYDCLAHQNSSAKLSLEQGQRNAKSQQKYKESTEMQTKAFENSTYFSTKKNSDPISTTEENILSLPKLKNLSFNLEATTCDTKILHDDKSVKQVQNSSLNADYFKKNSIMLEDNLKLSKENFTSLANSSLLKQTSLDDAGNNSLTEPYNLKSGENCLKIDCNKAITYDFLSIQSVQESNLNNSKINSRMSDDYSSDISCKNNLPGSTLQSPECSSNDFVISSKNVTPDLDTSVDLQFDKQSQKHEKSRSDYHQTVNAESFVHFSASEEGSNSNEASSDYASDISDSELNDFIVPDNYESFDEDATSNDDQIHRISDTSECEAASLKSSNMKQKLYNKSKSRKISATESDLSEDEESNKNDLKNLLNSDNKRSCYGTASSHSQLFNGNSGSEFYNKLKCKLYSKRKSRKMSTTESDSSGDEKSNKRNFKFLSDSDNKDSSYGTASNNSQLSIGNNSSKFLCDNRPQNNFHLEEHLFESKDISSGLTSFVSGDCDQTLTLQNISGDKTSTVSKNLLPGRQVESYEQLESKSVVSKVSNDKIFPVNAHLMSGISDVNTIHSSNLISSKLKSQKSVTNLESDISCNQARTEISEKVLIDIYASKNSVNELINTENSEEQHALESNSGSSKHLYNNWSLRRVSNKSVLNESILHKTKKQPKFKNSSTSSDVNGFDIDSHSISEYKIKTKEKLLGTSSDLFCNPAYSTTLLETQNKENDSDCQDISNKKKSLINSDVDDLSRTNAVHFSTQNNSKVPARTENGGQVLIDTYVSKNSSNSLIHIENAEEQHALESNSSNSKNLQTNVSTIVISNNSVLNESVPHKTKKQPRLKNSSAYSSINVFDIVFFNPLHDTTLPETQNKVNNSDCQDIPDKGKSLINFDVDDLSSRNVNPSTQNDGNASGSSKNTSFLKCEKFSESQTNETACASITDVRNLQILTIDFNESEHFSDHTEKSGSLSNEKILISKRALAEEEKTEENPPKKFKSITRDHLDTDESNKHINSFISDLSEKELDNFFGSLSDSFCKNSCAFIEPTGFDRSCNSCLFQIPTDTLLNTFKENVSLFQDDLNFDDVDPKLPKCTHKENSQVSAESENQKSVKNSDSNIQIKDLHLKRTFETSDNIHTAKFNDFNENLIQHMLNNPTARLDQQLNEMGFEMLPECNNVSTVKSLQPEVLNFEHTSGEKNCAKMIAGEEKSAKEIVSPSKADKRILFLYNEQKQSFEVCKIPDVSLLEILETKGSQALNSVDNPRKFSKKIENCDKLKNILNENFSCKYEFVDGVKYSIASLSPVVNLGIRCDDVEFKQNKLQTKLKVSPYKIPEGVICRRIKEQKNSTPYKKTDKCTRTIAAKNFNISRFQNNQTRNPEITSDAQHQISSGYNLRSRKKII